MPAHSLHESSAACMSSALAGPAPAAAAKTAATGATNTTERREVSIIPHACCCCSWPCCCGCLVLLPSLLLLLLPPVWYAVNTWDFVGEMCSRRLDLQSSHTRSRCIALGKGVHHTATPVLCMHSCVKLILTYCTANNGLPAAAGAARNLQWQQSRVSHNP